MSRFNCLKLLSLLLFLLGAPLSHAVAPKAVLWPYWEQANAKNQQTISHKVWDQLLRKYVKVNQADGINKFAYGDVTAADHAQLEQYLAHLQAIKITDYNKQQQLVYWINLYNALTVKVVLDHYPVTSILDITYEPWYKLWKFGPWDKPLLTIEGKALTLNDIEHRILRPIWQDHRVHYALNCASLGCPNLLNVAYSTRNIDGLLNQNEKIYINSPRGVGFKGGQLKISTIYSWFQEDFAASEQALIDYLVKHAAPALRAQLIDYKGTVGYFYDWRLNSPEA